jgi:hypothetical protein
LVRNDAKRCKKILNEMKRNDAKIVGNGSCFASRSAITKKIKMRNGRTLFLTHSLEPTSLLRAKEWDEFRR